MSYRYLAEGAVNLVVAQLKANLPAALLAVSAGVPAGLPRPSIETVKSWFIFSQPEIFEAPACFVIIDDMDFQIKDKKSNFINAQNRINVAICVEDQDANMLTIKAYRYLSALHSVLDETTMTSADKKLVLKSVVYRARFSDVYSRKEQGGKFRKEMMLECGVSHMENF